MKYFWTNLPLMNAQTLNEKLAAYRVQHRMSLREMAELLRITSGSTIKNWEDGDAIPGPPTLLLEWLIDGKVPFEASRLPQLPDMVKDAALKVSMNLEAWERLDALRMAGGYATMTDFIAGLIQEELAAPKDSRWNEADTRTSDQAPLEDVALLADLTTEDAAGGGDDVGAHTDAAAEVFAKKHPLPPAGATGAPAGTTAGRKDVIYKRLPRTSGTGIRKR